jgi:hypothetical protein
MPEFFHFRLRPIRRVELDYRDRPLADLPVPRSRIPPGDPAQAKEHVMPRSRLAVVICVVISWLAAGCGEVSREERASKQATMERKSTVRAEALKMAS